MRFSGFVRSRRSSACLRLAVLAGAFLAVFGAATAAQADVAYVGADKEVWISSLDGAIKERLSAGESEGEVKWIDTAQSDTGWVVGVRNIPGRIAQYSTFTVWNPQGAAIYNGPLAGETGGLSAYPLSLDLTNDGRGIIYGFSTFQQWYGGSSLTQGHYFLPSETVVSPVGGPLKQINKRYPTLFGGSRVVAALDRTLNGVQDASSIASETFVPWVDFSGVEVHLVGVRLQRTDVAASGTVIAFEVSDGDQTVRRIGVAPVSAIGALPLLFGDCFLPTDGNATSVSLSQDGSAIAWKDSGGVKVGGIPDFSGAEPCVLTRPAVTIAAGGQFPSIGAMSAAAIRAARSPGGGTGDAPGGGADDGQGGGTDDTPASKPLIVSLPAKVTAAALTSKAGLPLKVTVPAGGKIAVTASVPASRLGLKGNKAVVIATGSASPKSAGQVSVKLRLNAKGRKYRKRLRGLTLTLKITQGAKTTTKTIRLR